MKSRSLAAKSTQEGERSQLRRGLSINRVGPDWLGAVPGEEIEGQWVGLAVEVFEQGVLEHLVVGRRGHEQGHAGAEFQVVGVGEDLFSAAPGHIQNELGTFAKALT